MPIKRGDIYWADLNPVRGSEQAGVRPILIISQDILNKSSGTVIALAITSQKPKVGFPLVLEITSVKLPKLSWIKLSQIRTLATERLGKKLGQLSKEELRLVIEGLNEIVGES